GRSEHVDVAESADRWRAGGAAAGGRRRRPHRLLVQRVPLAAAGAAAEPLGALMAAVGADEGGCETCHGRTIVASGSAVTGDPPEGGYAVRRGRGARLAGMRIPLL